MENLKKTSDSNYREVIGTVAEILSDYVRRIHEEKKKKEADKVTETN